MLFFIVNDEQQKFPAIFELSQTMVPLLLSLRLYINSR
jgi:hypothetical protein